MSILIVLASLILTGCGGITAILGSSDSPTKTPPTKVISLDATNYVVAYDGEGSVTFGSSEITLAPKPATAANRTHAALVFIKETVDTPVQDFELTVDLATSQQLRQNTAANDWEVFWLFFGYKGNLTDKTTNYYISKPSSFFILTPTEPFLPPFTLAKELWVFILKMPKLKSIRCS